MIFFNPDDDSSEVLISDKEKIAEKINEHYASMYESNSEMVHAVFHPNASVTGYLHGELVEMTTDSFAAFVKSQQPSPKEKNDVVLLEILTSEMAGSTARCLFRDGLFRHAVFIKGGGRLVDL